MTSNVSMSRKRRTATRFDPLRVFAGCLGLFGAFFILGAAGASDAGLIGVGDILLRITLGAGLLLLWRALTSLASELEARDVRRPH